MAPDRIPFWLPDATAVRWRGLWVPPYSQPLSRAGCYVMTNTVNFKNYAGVGYDLFNRGKAHSRNGAGSPVRLRRAIQKYGVDNFSFVVVCYSITDRRHLLEIEAGLIAEYDMIANGYNVMRASEGIGPAGAAFSEILREAHLQPNLRQRHREVMLRTQQDDPGWSKKKRLDAKKC